MYPKIKKNLPLNSIFVCQFHVIFLPKGGYKFATTFLQISFNYCLSPVGKMFHQCYCEERESKGNQE